LSAVIPHQLPSSRVKILQVTDGGENEGEKDESLSTCFCRGKASKGDEKDEESPFEDVGEDPHSTQILQLFAPKVGVQRGYLPGSLFSGQFEHRIKDHELNGDGKKNYPQKLRRLNLALKFQGSKGKERKKQHLNDTMNRDGFAQSREIRWG
jgi:hypothetical protein